MSTRHERFARHGEAAAAAPVGGTKCHQVVLREIHLGGQSQRRMGGRRPSRELSQEYPLRKPRVGPCISEGAATRGRDCLPAP